MNRYVDLIAWSACAAAIGLSLALGDLMADTWIQWSPWILSLAIFGLAHGALDHQVWAIFKTSGKRVFPVAFIARYLVIMVLVVIGWMIDARLSLLLFLGVSAFHFGQGDLYWSSRYGLMAEGAPERYGLSLMLARGLLPIAIPLLAAPGEIIRIFPELGEQMFITDSPAGKLQISAAVFIIAGWQVFAAARHGFRSRKNSLSPIVEITETVLLAALFILTPPILATGIYFLFWHSQRHIARLIPVLDLGGGRSGLSSYSRAMLAFHKRGLPLVAASILIMISLGTISRFIRIDVVHLSSIAVIFTSALTLPHVLLVLLMDRRQGLLYGRLI